MERDRLRETVDSGDSRDDPADGEEDEGNNVSSVSISRISDAGSRDSSRFEFESEDSPTDERSLVWSEIHFPTCALTSRWILSFSFSEVGRALTKWIDSFAGALAPLLKGIATTQSHHPSSVTVVMNCSAGWQDRILRL
jgi:hypothetical protein